MTMTADRHVWPIRVYYEDTDFSGVVYHANYLRFMERARTEFLRALGIDQIAMLRDEKAGFVVRHMAIDFLKPARMDDALEVETIIKAVGGASIVLEQRVLRGAEALVTAQVRVAIVGKGRAKRLPIVVRSRLEPVRS